MNEKTIIEKRPTNNEQRENKKEGNAWKYVTLGGISGILMGAGLMYTGQAVAATEPAPDASEGTTPLPVAQLHNDLSFGEAFAAARAEVGPGGVFLWHGGIYNTYTADEWNAMSQEQKSNFAHQVNPEYHAHEVPTPTDDHPEVVAQTPDHADVQVVEQQIAENFDMGDDVHIVGYANANGHLVVGYDTTGDGQADVAIIDVDGNLQPSDADVIVDREGNMTTLGELDSEPDSSQLASMDNPDVAPDMPDYMNDANIDDMNILA